MKEKSLNKSWIIIAFSLIILLTFLALYEEPSYSPVIENQMTRIDTELVEKTPGALTGQEARDFLSEYLEKNSESEKTKNIKLGMIRESSLFDEVIILPDGNGEPTYITTNDWLQGKCQFKVNDEPVWWLGNQAPTIPLCADTGACRKLFGWVGAQCHQWTISTTNPQVNIISCVCSILV